MNIEPDYVEFYQAVLFKDKGFHSVKCLAYTLEGFPVKNYCYNLEGDKQWIARPEQWQVIKWASLVHNIDIEARPVRYAGDIKTSYYQPYINGCIINMSKFATKEKAYSAAFDYVLKELI
jgi:hypothetical protein